LRFFDGNNYKGEISMNPQFHTRSIEQSLQDLNSNPITGLSTTQAAALLETHGPNKLKSAKKKSLLMRILAQFKDFLVIILLVAAIVSIFVGDGLKDAILIMGILLVNVIISITQENRADNALAELKTMTNPKAKVKRGGHIQKIESSTLVPGDIVIIDTGDYIPADIRIIESINLKIDEASLTGESMPVTKDAAAILEKSASLGDRVNLASMGTVCTYGRGVGIVYATGMNTEMGKIASMLNETPESNTPLQDKLNALAKVLGLVCIITCALIFGIGLLYGLGIMEMFMVSVSLAVAAVPEGVAIVATIILAIGVQKMVKSNAIVKRLRAVETLGSTTVICSDKTGTLTQNKMTIVKLYDTENEYPASTMATNNNITLMVEIAAHCNDAIYDRKTAKIIGDPTEGALLAFAVKANPEYLTHKRIHEIPFDSERKLMSTYNEKNGKVIMNTKGAPDVIIKRSSMAYINGIVSPMTDQLRMHLIHQNEKFAGEALRVLAFGYKEYENKDAIDGSEEDLIYTGMMCMQDPPREEARAAIAQCKDAGINVKMITGDHKITAAAIAKSLGIMEEGEEALNGNDLDLLCENDFSHKVNNTNVFARVSPEHKVRIVMALKESGNIAAMTGDGVNDAPALKKADIGIAMGITGTDVTKEAADMILTDDNFVSIVKAVEQGRTIYSNIRKVTGYLLSCNIGEILIIFLAIVFGLPVPLVATQLLFVNLLTDAFPAFALGMEGKEPNIMKKPPRDPGEPIIKKSMLPAIAFRAAFLCAGSLGVFLFGIYFFDYATAISMCFFVLVAAELLVAFSSKTEARAGKTLFANKFLNISMGVSLVVLLAVMYVPALNILFTTVPLSLLQLGVCFGTVLCVVGGSELVK